jgi:hypothetical protein
MLVNEPAESQKACQQEDFRVQYSCPAAAKLFIVKLLNIYIFFG